MADDESRFVASADACDRFAVKRRVDGAGDGIRECEGVVGEGERGFRDRAGARVNCVVRRCLEIDFPEWDAWLMDGRDLSELRPLPKATFEPTLTQATVEHYREHGFTWIERITSDEEIEWLREVFDFLFESKMGGFAGGYFDLARPYDSEGIDRLPQVLVPELAIPELGETAFRRNARAVAAVLLSVAPEALEVWGHMIYKPPRIGNVTPWHQDEAYWDPGLHYTALGAWLPLDDVDLENGCMCFIPGSHRQDVLPHRHIDDDPAVHGLETTVDVDDSRMVAVPLPAGGATFHHSRLLHYTPPNRSNRPRRAFASEYQTTSQPSERPVDRSWWIEGQAAWEGRQPI